MSKRKFNCMEFNDGYGYMLDADIYTKEQAIEQTLKDIYFPNNPKLLVTIEYVKWVGNVPIEDRFYLDIKETGVHGLYMTCDKHDKGAFKCWRVRRDEE